MNPGAQDITAHVDFTTLRRTAEAEGLATLGFLDQTYFLMGLIEQGSQGAQGSRPNLVNLVNPENLDLDDRLALKTLLMPGGLGSTLKILLLGKGVGTPALRGCSYRMRVT
jgi:SAM-dependent MidA family methyltransferase